MSSLEETRDMKGFWPIVAFAIFWLHGACFFLIRYRLRRAGISVHAITDTRDAVLQYRQYFREAPIRGWSRSWVYLSLLCLTISIAIIVWWVLHLPRVHRTLNSKSVVEVVRA